MARDYPSNWDSIRKDVYARDGHQCQNCASTGVELHAHHIVPLSQGGSNNKSNLKTLCKTCHDAAHGRGQAVTGTGMGIPIGPDVEIEKAEMGFEECECGDSDLHYSNDDMVKCMNCDRVYQFEDPYITDAVMERFETCPGWFCDSNRMEYKPFYFQEEDRARMRCRECRKMWKVSRETGMYRAYSPSSGPTIGEWVEEAREGFQDRRDALLEWWGESSSGR